MSDRTFAKIVLGVFLTLVTVLVIILMINPQ